MMRLFSSRRESITADAARPRGAVRAALRARPVAAGTRAARAVVELRHAQEQGRRAGHRAAARGLGGQARADARRPARVGRPVGMARRRTRDAQRASAEPGAVPEDTGAEPRGAAGAGAGPAGEEHLDPRGPGQVPGPGPAPDRPGPGRRRRLLEQTWRTGSLRSEFEPVLCLEAPEPAELPRGLVRADGRSVYRRHGGTRYATRAQLAMEERMVAQAQATTAPRMTRAAAAHALGADLARLERALAGGADRRGGASAPAPGCARTRPRPRCRC